MSDPGMERLMQELRAPEAQWRRVLSMTNCDTLEDLANKWTVYERTAQTARVKADAYRHFLDGATALEQNERRDA